MSAMVPAAMRRPPGPYYCATCGDRFDQVEARDDHERGHLDDPDVGFLP